MEEWATPNCTAMKAPEEIPESDVWATSTLSAGSACGDLPGQDNGSATTHASSHRNGPIGERADMLRFLQARGPGSRTHIMAARGHQEYLAKGLLHRRQTTWLSAWNWMSAREKIRDWFSGTLFRAFDGG
jgi:hypothetical protein